MNVSPGQPVDVKLIKHDENYKAQLKVYKPLSGGGHRLGLPTTGSPWPGITTGNTDENLLVEETNSRAEHETRDLFNGAEITDADLALLDELELHREDDQDHQLDDDYHALIAAAGISDQISLDNRGSGIAAPKVAVAMMQTENANVAKAPNNAARGLDGPKTSSSAMDSPVRTRSRSRHRDPSPRDPDHMRREEYELERTRKELERYKLQAQLEEDEKLVNRPKYTRMARRYLSIETLRELRIDYTLDTVR
jgi:hypothetical protein